MKESHSGYKKCSAFTWRIVPTAIYMELPVYHVHQLYLFLVHHIKIIVHTAPFVQVCGIQIYLPAADKLIINIQIKTLPVVNLPSSAEAAAFWALTPPGAGKPWGVLLRLSSRPSSLRGALGAASSSGICFCRRRFLLHSSWQSCHSGRLEGRKQLTLGENVKNFVILVLNWRMNMLMQHKAKHTLVEASCLGPRPWGTRCLTLVQLYSVCWGPSLTCGQTGPGQTEGC